MPECILQVKGISKSFGGVQALDNVDLAINKGEVLCLAGENGSGKSTLIKIISGYHKPDSGTIEINGVTHSGLNPRDSLRAGIQVVYQDFSIFPNLTVAENISLSYLLTKNEKHITTKKISAIAKHAIEQIGVVLPLNAIVENLCVADKQLIAITRALLDNAKIIIMDEPTSALTYKEVQALFRVVRQLKEQGMAILFVSHKIEEIFDICDRITILNNGRNVISGPVEEYNKQKLVYYMTGREYSEQRLAVEVKHENPLLQVKKLSMKGYFEDITFDVYPGEVLGITGLLGSGRTELALSLFGKAKITSGEVILEGKPLKLRSVWDAIKSGISYIPEDRLTEGLFLDQSIQRNIIISNIDEYCRGGKVVNQRKSIGAAFEWIDRLGVKTNNPYNPVSTLSGGNQQKVVLSKGLATRPRVLILNGPTVGVDVGSKMDISRLIQRVAMEGIAVILISDDSTEILTNCKRILIMKNGRIADQYRNDDFNESTLYKTLIS